MTKIMSQLAILIIAILAAACATSPITVLESTSTQTTAPAPTLTAGVTTTLTPSMTPTVSQTATPTPIDIDMGEVTFTAPPAEWSTYYNESYGFTFEYPAVYDEAQYQGCAIHVTEVEDRTNIYLGLQSVLSISPSNVSNLGEHVDQVIADNEDPELWVLTLRQDDLSNGLEAVFIEYRFGLTQRYGTATFLRRDDVIFTFNFTAGLFCDIPERNISEFSAYQHMLNTFAFES